MSTILLIPSPAHRAALLAGDACGGAVPTMWRTRDVLHAARTEWVHGTECEDECIAGAECFKRVRCDWCGEVWPCADAGLVAAAGRWVKVAQLGDPPKGCVEALVLSLPLGLSRLREVVAVAEGLDPRYGVTFSRRDQWDGGAWYDLVAEDNTTLGDPSRWYASESIEQLMGAEADRILPALSAGPDEPLALGIIAEALGIGRVVEVAS